MDYTEEKGVIVKVIDSLDEEMAVTEGYISYDYEPFDNADDYYENGHKYVVRFDSGEEEVITWYDDEEFAVGDRVILRFWENGAEEISKDYEHDDKATIKH